MTGHTDQRETSRDMAQGETTRHDTPETWGGFETVASRPMHPT
jgi:hypothetical protein